jgi:hypothetical protein
MFKRALGAPPSHYFGGGVGVLGFAAEGTDSANPRRGGIATTGMPRTG